MKLLRILRKADGTLTTPVTVAQPTELLGDSQPKWPVPIGDIFLPDGSVNLIDTYPDYTKTEIIKAKAANIGDVRSRKDGPWEKIGKNKWKAITPEKAAALKNAKWSYGETRKKDAKKPTGIASVDTVAFRANGILLQARKYKAETGTPREQCELIDGDGTVLDTAIGRAASIRLTTDMLRSLAGHTYIHNHPSGRSFSDADIIVALVHRVGAIWAVSDGYSYCFKPDFDKAEKYLRLSPKSLSFGIVSRCSTSAADAGEPTPIEVMQVAAGVHDIEEITYGRVLDEVNAGRMTPDYATAVHGHEFMLLLALHMGGSYERFVWAGDKLVPDIQKSEKGMPPGVITNAVDWRSWKLQDRISFQGLPVSVENLRGSIRQGTDKDGHIWKTFMHFSYGYIRLTEGADGDHVDCYIGPFPYSDRVFVVHQNDPTTGRYDEDKVMLGFNDAASAKAAYIRQYDRPGFFGSMQECDMATFKRILKEKKGRKLTLGKALTPIIKQVFRRGKVFAQTFWMRTKGEAEAYKARLRESVGPFTGKSFDSLEFMTAARIIDYAPDDTAGEKRLQRVVKELFGDSAPEIEDIRETGAREVEYALANASKESTGEGWYSSSMKKLRAGMSIVHPNLAGDQNWTLFCAILAFTSPNCPVRTNFNATSKIWAIFSKTGKLPLRNPENGMNWPSPMSYVSLTRLQGLLDTVGIDGLAEWAFEVVDRKELESINPAVKGISDGDMEPRCRAFGPKVGPFLRNLTGDFSVATVDSWATRTIRRWLGQKDSKTEVRTNKSDVLQTQALYESLGEEFGLSVADVQAVMWYYEKRLYKALNIFGRNTASEEISYDELADELYERIEQGKLGEGGNLIPDEENAVVLGTSPSDQEDRVEKSTGEIDLFSFDRGSVVGIRADGLRMVDSNIVFNLLRKGEP